MPEAGSRSAHAGSSESPSPAGATLRLGTRGSALARAQSEGVAALLRSLHPGLTVTLVEITTQGDRTQSTNSPGAGWGQGVFVKEIEAALLRGEVDLAVHSAKDVPPLLPPGLCLAAFPERADWWDVLLSPAATSLADLPTAARVGTSSARRVAFLRSVRPDLRYLPIRGNVDARVQKLLAGEYDAIVLASAGLMRLGLQVRGTALDSAVLPPAPGQGALAIQARVADAATIELVRPLNHQPTAAAVSAERQLMARLEGGCRLPIAALGTPLGEAGLRLEGAVAAPDGARQVRATADGVLADPAGLAELVAESLLAQGAASLVGALAEPRA